MRREGRMPVAARRRPESSGLCKPFPRKREWQYTGTITERVIL